jgi:hypothetical protein
LLAVTMLIVVLFLATRELPAATSAPAGPDIESMTTGYGGELSARLSSADASGQIVPAAAEAGSPGQTSSLVADPMVSAADGDLAAQADDALALVAYPWRQMLPDWRIEFLPQRDGLYGLTLVPEKRIEIYVRPDQGSVFLAHVIAHELGHAVDVELNDESERVQWAKARGIEEAPWWPNSGATDFSTGAGDFAESFAAWQVGDGAFRSAIGDPPTIDELDLLARLSSN